MNDIDIKEIKVKKNIQLVLLSLSCIPNVEYFAVVINSVRTPSFFEKLTFLTP